MCSNRATAIPFAIIIVLAAMIPAILSLAHDPSYVDCLESGWGTMFLGLTVVGSIMGAFGLYAFAWAIAQTDLGNPWYGNPVALLTMPIGAILLGVVVSLILLNGTVPVPAEYIAPVKLMIMAGAMLNVVVLDLPRALLQRSMNRPRKSRRPRGRTYARGTFPEDPGPTSSIEDYESREELF